jgi:hypothetical protein
MAGAAFTGARSGFGDSGRQCLSDKFRQHAEPTGTKRDAQSHLPSMTVRCQFHGIPLAMPLLHAFAIEGPDAMNWLKESTS